MNQKGSQKEITNIEKKNRRFHITKGKFLYRLANMNISDKDLKLNMSLKDVVKNGK